MIIRNGQIAVDRGTEEDEQEYGARESLHLSEEGGLTQFVAHVQTLQPGSRSSNRHWHEEEDELLYVLSGEATVIEEDGPHTLLAGGRGECSSGGEPFWCALLLPDLRLGSGARRGPLPRAWGGTSRLR
jgi:uncharacterized cupin superfamily protein